MASNSVQNCFQSSTSEISNNNDQVEKNPITPEEIRSWKEKAIRKNVAIIGGGASGMSALKTFVTNGFEDVILLEAQDKLGGRIRTFRNGSLHIEEGAEWIHGNDGRNVVYKIAKDLQQLGTPLDDDDCDVLIVRNNGREVKNDYKIFESVSSITEEVDENGILSPFYDVGYGEYFIQRFREATGKEDLSQTEFNAWMHYLEQVINSCEGTGNWNDISATDADLFIAYGDDVKWLDGYDTLVTHFSKFLKSLYLLNTPVTKIFWDLEEVNGALIKTATDQVFIVDKVIVTFSVGCLKKWQNSVFVPSIPNPLRSALQDIELGNSNKIFCGWPKKWWGDNPLSLNILWMDHNLPENKEWLYGVVEILSIEEDANILRAFISGKYSLLMEEKDELEVQNDFIFLLNSITKNVHDIPDPNFFKRTRWNSNPWTHGSYGSYVTPEGNQKGIHSRKIFRKPIKNSRNFRVIYWAGEHTHDSRYGTVDGAVEAGFREAHRILGENKNIK